MTSRNVISEDRYTSKRLHFLSHIQYEHLIAGIAGGVISTLILHPFDLIKTRIAANDGQAHYIPQNTSLLRTISTTFSEEGVRGLYRGLVPNLWGSGFGWGIYFLSYTTFKRWMQNDDDTLRLSPSVQFMSASGAGLIVLLVTNPVWVVKIRLCLQCEHVNTPLGAPKLPQNKVYTGTVDALKKIYQYEGIRGLYNGFVPGLVGTAQGAVHLMLYEEMKNSYHHYRKESIDKDLDSSQYLVFAAVSKLFATVITYPYQVIRIRMQEQYRGYKNVRDCVSQIITYEGFTGFYKGLYVSIIRIVPGIMITFLIYEKLTHFLIATSDSEKKKK